MCCDSWGHKELDKTERLNRTELKRYTNLKYASYNVTKVRKSMKMRQDFETAVTNLRKFKPALIHLFIYLFGFCFFFFGKENLLYFRYRQLVGGSRRRRG